MKNWFLIGLTIFAFGLGCSSKAPEASNPATSADPSVQAKAALGEKLKSMTPEQRAAYIQQNPQEIQSTFGSSGVPNYAAAGSN